MKEQGQTRGRSVSGNSDSCVCGHLKMHHPYGRGPCTEYGREGCPCKVYQPKFDPQAARERWEATTGAKEWILDYRAAEDVDEDWQRGWWIGDKDVAWIHLTPDAKEDAEFILHAHNSDLPAALDRIIDLEEQNGNLQRLNTQIHEVNEQHVLERAAALEALEEAQGKLNAVEALPLRHDARPLAFGGGCAGDCLACRRDRILKEGNK